jgi:hypothetical protein
MQELTGLFLGAGASYEAGMPLVWELTTEIRAWLTPEKLRQFNVGWREQGGGHPDEVIDSFIAVLQHADVHYEGLLGYLQAQFLRREANSAHYHSLYSWLVQEVYYQLYLRHVRNLPFLEKHLTFYSGIKELAEKNNPLWIFSLNHDVLVEALAAEFEIPLHSGFSSKTIALPQRRSDGRIFGTLKAEVLSEAELSSKTPMFQTSGFRGINLLKIHGALDVFTFNNGSDLLKVLPTEDSAKSVLESLRAVNEDLFFPEPAAPNGRVNILNEIAYADEAGEMQFLRRTLLAGAYKFDKRYGQVLPDVLLAQFETNLNFVTNLVCMGFGFGDQHINSVIRGWLERSAARSLQIVNLGITSIPSSLLHLTPQIEIVPGGATDYFDAVAGIVRSRKEKLEKRLHICARRLGNERFWNGLRAFDAENFSDEVRKLAEQMKIASPNATPGSEHKPGISLDGLVGVEEDRLERLALHLEGLFE